MFSRRSLLGLLMLCLPLVSCRESLSTGYEKPQGQMVNTTNRSMDTDMDYILGRLKEQTARATSHGNFSDETWLQRKLHMEQVIQQAAVLKEALAEAEVACDPTPQGYPPTRHKRQDDDVRQQTGGGGSLVGAGYSSDSQQVLPQKCFNATVSSRTEQQASTQLDTSVSFSELERKLGVSLGISGGYGAFSVDAKASYMRSFQDNEYSLSLNYYYYATEKVAVRIKGYGEESLTEFGKSSYDGGKNPLFGVVCGDHYIKSFQQGALLTMGINIKFVSSTERNEFEQKAGVSFGSIVSAAQSVNVVANQHRLSGTVTIQAFQMGGEPSQLHHILSKDSSDQYYALSCSLTAMDNCVRAVGGLLDYAKTHFSTQFSFLHNTGLTPLGNGFAQYNPISYIGLTSASLITAEVKKHQDDLFRRLKENEYYVKKFYPFFNRGYPVELDPEFTDKARRILNKANRNVDILRQTQGGAADCFNYPDKCKGIKASIDSQLRNITTDDLKFLDAIKYEIIVYGMKFYSKGTMNLFSSPYRGGTPKDNYWAERVFNVKNLFDKTYYFHLRGTDESTPTFTLHKCCSKTNGNGTSTDNQGCYCNWKRYVYENGRLVLGHQDVEMDKSLSQFFFEAFDSSNWDD